MIRLPPAAALAALLAVAPQLALAADSAPTAIVPIQRWQKQVAPGGFDADGQRAYFFTTDGKLAACDLKTGAPLWTAAVPGPPDESTLRLLAGVVLREARSGQTEAHDPTGGARLWTRSPRQGGRWSEPPGGGLLLVEADTVHLVDPRTGVDRSKLSLPDRAVGMSAEYVYTVARPPAPEPGLHRTSLRDGRRTLVSATLFPVRVDEIGGTLVCVDGSGVSGVRASDGQKLWTFTPPAPKRPAHGHLLDFEIDDDPAGELKLVGQRLWLVSGYDVIEVDPASGRSVTSTLPSLDELNPVGLSVELLEGRVPAVAARLDRSAYWARLDARTPQPFLQPEQPLTSARLAGDTLLGLASEADRDGAGKPRTATLIALALSDTGKRVPLPRHEPPWVQGATTRAAVVVTSGGSHEVSPRTTLVVESLQAGGPGLRKQLEGTYTLRYVPERKGYLLLDEDEVGAWLMIVGIAYVDERTAALTWSRYDRSEENQWGAWAFEISDDARYVAFVASGSRTWSRWKLQVLDTVTDRMVTLGPPPPLIEKPDPDLPPDPDFPPFKGWNDERLDHVIQLAPGMMSITDGVLKVSYGKPGRKSTRTRTWDLRRVLGTDALDEPRKL